MKNRRNGPATRDRFFYCCFLCNATKVIKLPLQINTKAPKESKPFFKDYFFET